MLTNDLVGTQPSRLEYRLGRSNARGKHSEVDVPTIRASEVDQMKKKGVVKPLRKRGRSTTRPTDPEEGHMGATETPRWGKTRGALVNFPTDDPAAMFISFVNGLFEARHLV